MLDALTILKHIVSLLAIPAVAGALWVRRPYRLHTAQRHYAVVVMAQRRVQSYCPIKQMMAESA